MHGRIVEIPQQQSQRNTFLWSPIRKRISFTDSRLWVSGSECVFEDEKMCCYLAMMSSLTISEQRPPFWSGVMMHGALKVFCCCVSYCFLSSLLACCLLYLRDQPLLWVAGHTTATGVGPECQSRQSVGGIVGVIDHWETDVQSCPCADTNTNPKKLCVCKLDCFLMGLKFNFIRLYQGSIPLLCYL